MRWGDARRSDNVEDDRGVSGGGGGGRAGGLTIGGVVLALVLSYVTGTNPLQMLGLVEQVQQGGAPSAQQPAGGAPPANDPMADFTRAILGDTEDTWTQIFSAAGKTYEKPHLVLFSRAIQSGCGNATTASGPFYCPEDHKVYLDMDFFNEMKAKLGGGGDFAQAYVIAHEVGHHVQNLLGIEAKVEAARAQGAEARGADSMSVKLELQADCFAGVWANAAQARHQWLDPGDVEQALNTATAIGDDRLQKQGQGYVVPDSFTHGTSAQRVKWFQQGFQGGDVKGCDTFGASAL